MTRKSIATLIVVGALAAVAALGAFTYQTVYAQEATPTAPQDGSAMPQGRGYRGEGGTQHLQDLADALGIDLTALQAAQQKAFESALAQAVENGLITQAQADQLKVSGMAGRHMGMMGRWNDGSIDMQALLAEALGISTDELTAAQQQAYTAALDRAVANGEITQEQADLMKARQALYGSDNFQSSMQSAFETAVQQAVTDGVITQAQADQILAEQAQRGGFGKGFGFPGGMRGGGRGHGGGMRGGGMHGRGGMWGTPDTTTPDSVTPDSTTPSSTGGDA